MFTGRSSCTVIVRFGHHRIIIVMHVELPKIRKPSPEENELVSRYFTVIQNEASHF